MSIEELKEELGKRTRTECHCLNCPHWYEVCFRYADEECLYEIAERVIEEIENGNASD